MWFRRDCSWLQGRVATDERRPREMLSSTGDGRRQYKSNGGPRAWKGLGSARRRQEGAAEGGVCGVRAMLFVKKKLRPCHWLVYEYRLQVESVRFITVVASHSLLLLSRQTPRPLVATAIADSRCWECLAPYSMSYVQHRVCARERLRTLWRACDHNNSTAIRLLGFAKQAKASSAVVYDHDISLDGISPTDREQHNATRPMFGTMGIAMQDFARIHVVHVFSRARKSPCT